MAKRNSATPEGTEITAAATETGADQPRRGTKKRAGRPKNKNRNRATDTDTAAAPMTRGMNGNEYTLKSDGRGGAILKGSFGEARMPAGYEISWGRSRG